MELSEHNSNKYLQCPSPEPLSQVFKQLRQADCREGDYVRLTTKDVDFRPIFRVTASTHPIRGDALHLESRLSPEPLQKCQLSFGSQIFLKNETLPKVNAELIRPHFTHLYTQLRVGRGLVVCREGLIEFGEQLSSEAIWMCIAGKEETDVDRLNMDPPKVRFCNIIDSSYLQLDINGNFAAATEDRASLFSLRQAGSSTVYVLSAAPVAPLLSSSKSRSEMKKLIDRSLQRTDSRRMQFQAEILPVQDTMISIHMELTYARFKLEQQPSLKLVHLVLNELIYYDIPEFVRDGSLLNEAIIHLLFEHAILHQISTFLGDWQAQYLPLSESANAMLEVVRLLNLLCRRSQPITELFIPLLDQLITSFHNDVACALAKHNPYFSSQFQKAKWHNHISNGMIQGGQRVLARNLDLVEVFCASTKWSSPTQTMLWFRRSPATSNQYLVHHSLRNNQTRRKIFQLELYVQGAYAFVRHPNNLQDVELNTLLEPEKIPAQLEAKRSSQDRSSLIRNSLQRDSKKQQSFKDLKKNKTKKDSPKKQSRKDASKEWIERGQWVQGINEHEAIIAQLRIIHFQCRDYNLNILQQYWQLIYTLAPYTYKPNFPNLSNPLLKKIILQLVTATEPASIDPVLLSRSRISFALAEGEADQGKMEEGRAGEPVSRNSRKRAHAGRKLIRQMGENFLKKCKQWQDEIRKKNLSSAELIERREELNLLQWLELMSVVLSLRLLKVREKRQGQLLGYFRKLFEAVQGIVKSTNEGDCSLVTYFVDILLELLKYHPPYDNYLQQMKARRNYQGRLTDQINRVISNFQSKRSPIFTKPYAFRSKNEVFKSQSGELNEQEKQVKIVSVRLIGLIIASVNEEMVEEAIETLQYLVKNPSNISNLSSFSLLTMLPKYPFEAEARRAVLQQWYLASNCRLFDELTTLLRYLIQKKLLFRRSINDVLLFDRPNLLPLYLPIVGPSRHLRKTASIVQNWLRPALLQKYPQPYQQALRSLQVVVQCLEKLKQSLQGDEIGSVIENLELLHSLRQILEYMSEYFIQAQGKPQLLPADHFVNVKLNPLLDPMLRILELYVLGGEMGLKFKIILSTFGHLLALVAAYRPVLMRLYAKCEYKDQILAAIRLTTIPMLTHMATSSPPSTLYFKLYLQLELDQLIRQMQRLYESVLNTHEKEEAIFKSLIFAEELEEQKQSLLIIFLKITVRLLQNSCSHDYIDWFRNKGFKRIMEKHAELARQQYYRPSICLAEIARRQLIVQVGHYFILSPLHEEDNEQEKLRLIEYILEEVSFSRQLIGATSRTNDWQVNDDLRSRFYEYLLIDLGALAMQLDVLTIGEVTDHLRFCLRELKDIYKRRYVQKNEEALAIMQRAEQILSINSELVKPRVIPFAQANQSSEKTSQRKTKSKPLRKWEKAITQLNNQKMIPKGSELVQEMLTFEDIYEFKNENEVAMVINHTDLFSKLIETALASQRLGLSLENQFFLLEQIYLLLKVARRRKEPDMGIMTYGQKMFEHLVESEGISLFTDLGKESPFCLPQWTCHCYIIGLQLQIIAMSRFFEVDNARDAYLDQFAVVLRCAAANLAADQYTIELLAATLPSVEQREIVEAALPLTAAFSIFEQINYQHTNATYLKLLSTELVRAHLNIGEQPQKKGIRSDISKLVDRMDKNTSQQAFKQVLKSQYYQCLFTVMNQ